MQLAGVEFDQEIDIVKLYTTHSPLQLNILFSAGVRLVQDCQTFVFIVMTRRMFRNTYPGAPQWAATQNEENQYFAGTLKLSSSY